MNEKLCSDILKESTILLILSEKLYNDDFKNALELKCKKLRYSSSIKEATSIYNTNKIDIIISEVIFENEDILKFCHALRKINKNIPIILLGSITDTKVLLEFIKLNLTEYILNPININILKHAIDKAAWQIYDNGLFEIKFQETTYNIQKKELFEKKNNSLIPLSQNEVKLLDTLVYNRHLVLSKERLMDSIWENSYEITDEAFKSLLCRLRQKIGKDSIKNISGIGYRLIN